MRQEPQIQSNRDGRKNGLLNITAYFLSQKRLNEVLPLESLPTAARFFDIAEPRNAGLSRTAVISAYETAAIAWLNERKFPSLGQLITEGRVISGAFFTHAGPFFGREIEDAAIQFAAKGYTSKKPILWTKLDGLQEALKLTFQAHPDNYTTKSAPGEMAGKNHLFVVGRITELTDGEIQAQGYIVGRLHEEPRRGIPVIDRFNRLPWNMEVFPIQINEFALGSKETTPTPTELKLLKSTREEDVKNAFAEILGEPFVPRDWGGERSDLVTSNLSIEGVRVVAAFAFKGKSVPRPLRIKEMGDTATKEADSFRSLQTSSSFSIAIRSPPLCENSCARTQCGLRSSSRSACWMGPKRFEFSVHTTSSDSHRGRQHHRTSLPFEIWKMQTGSGCRLSYANPGKRASRHL